VGRIVWAWVLTLPVTGIVGFWTWKVMKLLGAT
jgi:PiT family inorganic phosphate transporter